MDKIFIIDASGYIYRSYYAIKMMTNSKGQSTNALFGFIRSILKLIKDFNPPHLVAVFDGPHNAKKRTEIYPAYKAHRQGMPPDLLYQIHWAKEFCQLYGIPELMIPEVEADDTIGSVAIWAAAQGATAYLCTSDKDMCQIVTDKILMLNTFKDNLILTPKEVEKQFGVPPKQMIDYLSIIGDASDNVPGIPGFGPKTATELLKAFGSLDYILEHPLEIPGKKKQDLLIENKDQALLSRKLILLDLQVPVPSEPDFYQLGRPVKSKLTAFYSEYNFSSLLRELELAPSKPIENATSIIEDVSYTLIDEEKELNDLVLYLSNQKEIAFDTKTDSLSPMRAKLVGIGFAVEPKKAWYIPTNRKLGLDLVVAKLKPLLENPTLKLYAHNMKYHYHILLNHGIKIASISFDTILASYILNSHSRQHSLDFLVLENFNKIKTPIQNLIGKGKKQISMNEVELLLITPYCCEDVDYTVRLKHLLLERLQEKHLEKVFYEIELPLIKILAEMERHGIYLNVNFLNVLSREINKDITRIEHTIFELAGETFNLNSPKQLSEILFTKLGIKPPKKTATGYSTDGDVLEKLRQHYPIASHLLEYRSMEKLRSTYIEALPQEVHPITKRIHCNFNQVVTATGRLSCQDPNLQNIPVRTPQGLSIREAFLAEKPDWSFLAADYSQIELRILAHLSEDPALIEAFQANKDIHTYTASLIFNIPLELVSKEQRYLSKAVNFGIVYGQQAFGLAQSVGIENKVAAEFIHMYFQRYHKVKDFIEACKQTARLTGKAVTLFGRERLIPEINSKNGMIRSAAERLAINMPIQGTQADIIKLAMIQIDKRLREEQKEGYMILQIHDELVFEVPDREIPVFSKIVRETMEGVIGLKVPLIVDIHIGKNWKEC